MKNPIMVLKLLISSFKNTETDCKTVQCYWFSYINPTHQ